ncbi:hypothetical protein M2277_005660 [Paenibacillus sp. LBL]|uniref:hypothetical protein n=1 Tax=Paenibacillus sp. LBL TaxID=2940563 RepID=UPI002475A31F|nr:hypothetical protein [Paenibacillus sp. LBL]MDH6674961.1 hypothetical protein [Paenibacillus sp. LBL]
MKKTILFLLAVALIVVGCSSNKNTNPSIKDDAQNDVTNTTTYLNEEDYTGEEQEIVQVLNRYLSIFAENNVAAYGELYVDPKSMENHEDLGKEVIEITNLDFNPDVSDLDVGTNDKVVEVSKKQKIPRGDSNIVEDKQLFCFTKINEGWKIKWISD